MPIRAVLAFILSVLLSSCADARPRGAPDTTPQIFYNIVSDGGAACNGDVVTATRTASITSGTKNLSVTSNLFSSGDVGKAITIPGAGNSGGTYFGTIATFTNAQNVVLNNNATTTLSGVSTAITYGTDDAPKFDTFNNWARANQGSTYQVVLTIPTGKSCWFGSGTFNYISVFNAFAAGINNLMVEGTGATINSVGGQSFQLGGLGTCFVGLTSGCSARLQNVSAGASTVTLTADSFSAGYISRFSVGKRVLVGGLDPQAIFDPTAGYGDPVNLWAFEWRTITAICNNTGACPGAAVITLNSPLVDSYSASWPEYNKGDNFHSDGGGPATIWALDNTWETTVEYRGLTISQEGQTYAQGRNVTYRNVTFTGDHAAIPTQNEAWSAINTSFGSANMETDKLVTTMLFDGVTIAQVVNQSTATKRLIIRNSTFTNRLDGGAQYTEISDSNLGIWSPGIYAYGSLRPSDITTCTRCTISSIGYSLGPTTNGNYNYFLKSGGIITMPNAGAQGSGPGNRYWVPGALVFYSAQATNPPTAFSNFETIGSFQVTTITADPWPSITDNQTLTTTISIGLGSSSLNVPSGPFVSGDVGKTIVVGGAGDSGGTLKTFITGYSSATDVTLFNAATTAVASASKTIQWGTSNTYISTNQSGGFPSVSAFSTGLIGIKTLSTPNITCDVCNAGQPTTDAYAISLQAGAAAAKPLGAYTSKQYSPTSAQGDLAAIRNRDIFKSLSINVTAAATSVGSVTLNPGAQFHWIMIDQNIPTAPVIFDWLPGNLSINLKQTGNRVITPSGVTCNGSPGACSGDSITPPANLATMWIPSGSMLPFMGSTHTGAPTFTITLQTDPIQ